MRVENELWHLAAMVACAFSCLSLTNAQIRPPDQGSELPPPIKPPVDGITPCVHRWMYEPSFMMWLVRLTLRKTADQKSYRHDVGTGSLISRRHVLTSCYPIERLSEEGLSYVDVFPSSIRYAAVKPSAQNGTFPWAMKDDGCFDKWFTVTSTIAPRGCNINYQADAKKKKPFLLNATADSYLILALAQEAPLVSENSQYMPFDFDIDRNLRVVRWYQSIRRARCVIPRIAQFTSTTLRKQSIVQGGFTYSSMPFNQECLVKLCTKYCDFEENFKKEGATKAACKRKCIHKFGRSYQGRLLCLRRMRENIKEAEMYSTVLDVDNKHTPYKREGDEAQETCNDKSIIHGAPVVCNGEVIAIVTQCFENDDKDPFLVASTLTPIHHQLLKWGPIY